MTRRRWLLLAATLVAVLLLLGRLLAMVYVDVQWYRALGATTVWRERAVDTLLVWCGSAAAGLVFFLANLYAVRRSVVTLILPRRVANIEIGEEVPRRLLTMVVVGASAVLGMLLAMPAGHWTLLALARHGLPFGDPVPYLEVDLSFFVYWIPFERAAYEWSLLTVIVATAVVVFLYSLTPSLRWDRGSLRMSTHVRRHIALLAAVALLLLAWHYRLDAFEAFVRGSGSQGFVTPADRAIALRLDPLLTAVGVIAAIVVAFSGWRGQMRVVIASLSVVLASSLVIRQVFPALAQRIAPPDTWAAFDTAAIANRAIYSRRAFAADRILGQAPRAAYATWADALPWLSVWDPRMLIRAIRSSEDATTTVGDVAWWADAGELSAAAVEPPADLANAPAAAWTIVRVAAQHNRTGGESPGQATDGGPAVVRRAARATFVYPGAGAPLIVGDSAGTMAATPVRGWVSRIAHAWSEQQPQLLGEARPRHPSILRLRDVHARLREIVPFLSPGTSSVPVISGDTIVWVVELYSASADYPFSLRVSIAGEERSYFHHTATALVNGHSGHVTLVRDRALEPIGATWVGLFPELFVEWDEIPPAVSAFVPPALDGARVAAYVLARYGERASSPLPLGDLAPGLVDSAFTAGAPVIGLPGVPPVAAWVWPVLDAGDFVRGIVVARGGRDHAMTFQTVDGVNGRWHTWLERLGGAVDSAAAARMPELSSGATRAVPLATGLALYKTWYNVGPGGVPVVYRVAVATADTVRFGSTLAEAVGGDVPSRGPTAPSDVRARLAALYDRMRDALRRGDWVTFGAAMDSLGALLGRRGR